MNEEKAEHNEAYNYFRTKEHAIGPVEEIIVEDTVIYYYSIEFRFTIPDYFEEEEFIAQLPNPYFISLRNQKSEVKMNLNWLKAAASVYSSDEDESSESNISHHRNDYYENESEWEEEADFYNTNLQPMAIC